jgi:hypothetical protein
MISSFDGTWGEEVQTLAGLELLITLDDPWNAQECDAFYNRQAERPVTYWAGRTEPTTGRRDRPAEDILDNASYVAT